MLREGECVNRNTSVKSKDSGRKNLKSISSREKSKWPNRKDKNRRKWLKLQS